MEQRRELKFRAAIVFLAVLLLGSFWLTVRDATSPLSITVIPQAPREGEPIIVTFRLSNPSAEPLLTEYQLYVGGRIAEEGNITIAGGSAKVSKYAYGNPLPMGEQLNFVIRSQSELGDYEKVVSLPSYAPQIWSSFVSFASFSTTVMSSISTMTYYQSAFASDVGLNVGVVVSAVLLALLIFVELTHPVVEGRTIARVGRLRLRFSTVTWILLIIFTSMVYTRVVFILTANAG